MADGIANGVATVHGFSNAVIPGIATGVATVLGFTNEGIGEANGFATVTAQGLVAYAAIANCTENVVLIHVVLPASSTANATSVLSGNDVGVYVETAAATSILSGSKQHTESFVETASATEVVVLSSMAVLSSSANATSSVSYPPYISTYVSTANATSTISPIFTAISICVSTANAIEVVSGYKAITLTDSAAASEVVIATRVVGIVLVSTGTASEVTQVSGQAVQTLVSTALASSVISSGLVAYQTLISSADASSHIILEDMSLQAFWTNPLTTAAGTWSGMPFETMIEQDGEMYAAGVDGIYKVQNTIGDDGRTISAEILTDLC
jgi:hypothetical protein